jgi:hypothetical protein
LETHSATVSRPEEEKSRPEERQPKLVTGKLFRFARLAEL